jgi:hypothetical protein
MSNGPTVEDPNSPVGQISGTQQGLAQFAGPYVTEMLGKGMALADKPFEAYTGPLTAGASGLQEQAFAGYAGLDPNQQTGIGSFGGNMTAGGTFGFGDAAGQGFQAGFTPASFTAASAQQFMNPYLQAALEPQLREARRQADISRVADAGRLTRAGAFGGSRQAIMEAEGARNLGTQLADITGRGYSDAFTQAQRQFNVEQEALRRAEEARRGQFNIEADRLSQFDERRRQQANEEARREIERQERERKQFNEEERRRIAAEEADRRFGLSALRDMRTAGQEQRDIEQEGITADYLQFQQEQQYPYEQLQFMQSLLQGLPITATSRQFVEPGGFQQISGGLAGLLALLGGGT